MNVFLFLPFGFLLAFVAKRNFLQSLLIGFAFSVCIEALQYVFSFGMCEIDDVFHNSLGTSLGYGYWKALRWLEAKHGKEIRVAAHRAMQYARRLGSQTLADLKNYMVNKKK